MSVSKCVELLLAGCVPSSALCRSAMQEVVQGSFSHSQLSALLTVLEQRSLQPYDSRLLAAFAQEMRDSAAYFPELASSAAVMDLVGTGGDGFDSFNVTTTAALVVAACGVKVLKHGNRAASSKAGSADLLERIGACLDLDGEQAAEVLEKVGFCFLFAQKFHGCMRHVSQVRKELGFRTIFNVLGPLTNPGRPGMQVSGVSKKQLGMVYAQAFVELGIQRGLVVHGMEGLDEISIAGETLCWIVENGNITQKIISPEDFGVPRHSLDKVRGGSLEQNLVEFWDIVNSGKPGPVMDFVLINAAAALFTAGKVFSFKDGVAMAKSAILDGSVKRLVQEYVRYSQEIRKSSTSILDEIYNERVQAVQKVKASKGIQGVLLDHLSSTKFDAISRIYQTKFSVALMGEIKRASPSKGPINLDVDVEATAISYAKSGVSVISVLTEPKWFRGSIQDLKKVRLCLDSISSELPYGRPAILLKDFVVDELQLVEAKTSGADLALLIVKMLTKSRLVELFEFCKKIGLEALVEVNNEEEMKIALEINAKIIGINNRNLHDFSVDTNTTIKLQKLISPERRAFVVVCSLSGISSSVDLMELQNNNVDAVLIGESLMRSKNPNEFIKNIMPLRSPLVKVCGIRTPEDALLSIQSGAHMIGIIFAESKRKVSIADAQSISSAIRQSYPLRKDEKMAFLEQIQNDGHIFGSSKFARFQSVIMRWCRHLRPLIIGVFKDQSIQEINSILETSSIDIDLVQLHGSESKQFANEVRKPVIRVIHVSSSSEQLYLKKSVEDACDTQNVCAILFDTTGGGAGKTFDWSLIRPYASQIPVMVAGGLNASNVESAVDFLHPWCVDVSSGIEVSSEILRKDPQKLQEFIRNSQMH